MNNKIVKVIMIERDDERVKVNYEAIMDDGSGRDIGSGNYSMGQVEAFVNNPKTNALGKFLKEAPVGKNFKY